MEIARVAFCLACSMSCSKRIRLVLVAVTPGERLSDPDFNARANSRWVCCRPFGVVYQSASSASDLNWRVLRDLRGIFLPFNGIHFACCDGTKLLPSNREDHYQIPPGCCFPNSFQRSSSLMVAAGITTGVPHTASSTSNGVTA